jgi:trans-aconitate 2-methyltransferase
VHRPQLGPDGMKAHYTFGDDDRAADRLRRLAAIYEQVTRELLARGGLEGCGLAADLGCGEGWSTALLRDVLAPARTVGLDASRRFVDQARASHGSGLEFMVHDVTRAPFPVRPDLMLCRFLLTHLADAEGVLATWAGAAAPAGRLLIHETESLGAAHPALTRYYELVAQLQRRYGQRLDVGARLDAALARSPWRVLESRAVELRVPAPRMAELHLANLQTWRNDDHARQAFDPAELDGLEASLARIVAGAEPAGPVSNLVRQIVAEVA